MEFRIAARSVLPVEADMHIRLSSKGEMALTMFGNDSNDSDVEVGS